MQFFSLKIYFQSKKAAKSHKSKTGGQSKDKAATKSEKASSSDSIFACDVCPKKFFKKHRYDAHMRKHSGLKGFLLEINPNGE